ncbi:hypothetical protein ACFLQO_00705, partial [Candidatus Aenigmatarchaeota archaeon]
MVTSSYSSDRFFDCLASLGARKIFISLSHIIVMSKTGSGREKMYLAVIVILILVLAGFYLQSFLVTGSQVQAVDKVKGVYE